MPLYEFQRAGVDSKQASADADVLIVNTAKSFFLDYDCVSEDIDLPVLVIF